MRCYRSLVWAVLGLMWIQPPAAPARSDQDAVRLATQRYRDAWLANDPEAVMRTLTAEPVPLPSGHPAIVGATNARAFWWPQGAGITRVVAMELYVDKVDVSGELA